MVMGPDDPRLVSEVLDDDDGRQISAFVPPMAVDAVVYAADGGWHIQRLAQALGDAGIGSIHGRRCAWSRR